MSSPRLILSLSFGALIASFLFSMAAGQVVFPFHEYLDWVQMKNVDTITEAILTDLRLPRTFALVLVGSVLGSCGLVMQSLLRNPLAEPYTLGLSGGAAVGAVTALALSLEPQSFWVPTLSVAGCWLAAGLVLVLARRHLGAESRSLILLGVLISLFFGALVVFGFSLLSPEKLQTAMLWLLGEFGSSRDKWAIPLALPLLLPLGILFLRSSQLDALVLGEARALSLGVSLKLERFLLLLLTTWMTALSVSIAGLVGFIGLVAPHLARRISPSSKHKVLLALSACLGGALLTFADSLGRIIANDFEIPAGSVSALIGVPVLIALLIWRPHAQVE